MLDATALSFGQEVVKTIFGAVATAAIVTVGGGLTVSFTTRSWQARRELFDLRTAELERATGTAQRMYVACQHARRVLRESKSSVPDDEQKRAATLAELSDKYLQFSADAALIETVLGARFGVRWAPDGAGLVNTPPGDNKSDVYWRWHQIRDLLTVYYFNLQGEFRDGVLARNTRGFQVRYHSGLDLSEFVDEGRSPHPGDLSRMRRAIRRTYDEALSELAKAMLKDKIRAG